MYDNIFNPFRTEHLDTFKQSSNFILYNRDILYHIRRIQQNHTNNLLFFKKFSDDKYKVIYSKGNITIGIKVI